jgi:hypothetical protein
MHRERVHHRAAGTQSTADAPGVQQTGPGKHTLTEELPVQRRAAMASGAASVASGATASSAGSASVGASNSIPLDSLFGARREAAVPTGSPEQVHAAAARGTATPATRLPFADQIQRSFGRHDVSGIQAHAGPDAAGSARAIGAQGYAAGNHVVFDEGADLHTVAHEAAHVVQQRGGVQLLGGVGAADDAYEAHADEVAAAVVAGESAEAMLDTAAPGAEPESADETDPAAHDADDAELADAAQRPGADADAWQALAPRIEEAMQAVPEATEVDRSELARRAARADVSRPPPGLAGANLAPLIARGAAELGAPAPAMPSTETPSTATPSTGAVQLERRDRGTLTSNRAQQRYQKQQHQRQQRRQRPKSGRAQRREQERQQRRAARGRKEAEVSWLGVLLLVMVLSASVIEVSNTIERGRLRDPGPVRDPRGPGSTTEDSEHGVVSVVSTNTTREIDSTQMVTTSGGNVGGDVARLPTRVVEDQLRSIDSKVADLILKRAQKVHLEVEGGFKINSALDTTSLGPLLAKCNSDKQCVQLAQALYLKTVIDKTIQQIWNDKHDLVFVGETHDNPSSMLIKTHLMCALSPGQRYIHFEEGIARNLTLERDTVEMNCNTTDGPSTEQRVVRGVENELQNCLGVAVSAHDQFQNDKNSSLDSHDVGLIKALLTKPVVYNLTPKLLNTLAGGAKDLLLTLLRSSLPRAFVKSDWIELTGKLTESLIVQAEQSKLDTTSVKKFMSDPTSGESRHRLSEDFLLGARNQQWAKVIKDSQLELGNVKGVVVLGDKHASGLAQLLGKSLPDKTRSLESPKDGSTKPGESPKQGESQKPSLKDEL